MSMSRISLILLTTLILSGCGGSAQKLADNTYGVPNSKWAKMTDNEKYAAEQRYKQEIRVIAQRKLTEQMREQNERQTLARIEERLANIERRQSSRPVRNVPTTTIFAEPIHEEVIEVD